MARDARWHLSALLEPTLLKEAPHAAVFLTQAAPLSLSNRIVAVIKMSKARWLIAALVAGFKRHPLKKIDADPPSSLKLLQRWCDEAGQAGHTIKRTAVAYQVLPKVMKLDRREPTLAFRWM
ncbi:hypothetical protein [Mesorhizobium sp. WSM1293]|uniref:hypothetical protein n=1 Tax=Mesorhizobium sp. WSM1293 TaxID=1040984 RepID=UPI0004861DB7|nr:hypothetical protein [Mesorhizobium sp. WSM1293]